MPWADGDASQSGVVEGYAIDITVQSPERTDSSLLGRLHCDPALHMRASCSGMVAALKDGRQSDARRSFASGKFRKLLSQCWCSANGPYLSFSRLGNGDA